MYKYILLVVLTTIPTLSSVFDWQEIEVGSQPSEIIMDSEGTLHVFCLGKDSNFDGVFDEETDEVPSWWTIDLNMGDYVANKIMDFDFQAFTFPFYPGFNKESQEVYLTAGNKILSYSLIAKSKQREIVAIGQTVACSAIGGETLLITTKELVDSEDPSSLFKGMVTVYDLEEDASLFNYEIGLSPAKTVATSIDDIDVAASICAGDYSAGNSSIHFFFPETENSTSYNISDTPNDIIATDDAFITVSNGGHAIEIHNLKGEPEIFETGTSSFDGPRRAVIHEDSESLFISTYAGDIRRLKDGKVDLYISVPDSKKVEDFYYSKGEDDREFIATALISNIDYSPNNTVGLLRLTTSVDLIEKYDISLYPNPASDFLTISFKEAKLIGKEYSIYNLFGEKITTGEISSNNHLIDLTDLNLINGKYFISLDDKIALNFIINE